MLLAPPPGLVTLGNYKVLDVLCKNVKVPEITNEPIELKYKGHTLKVPGRTNQELSIEITFYLDEFHNTRQLFHDWITAMDDRFYAFSSNQAAEMSKVKDYFGSMMLKARDFDETKQEPMNYLFEGVYPTSVSGPEFNSAGTGEINEITVTFSYFRFLSKDTTASYDELDAIFDELGISPMGYDQLGSFGQLGDLINRGLRSVADISDAVNAIGGLFE
jgi:hypothetical protein